MPEILICENDDLVRRTLEQSLSRRGHRIQAFSNGEEAISWLAAHPGAVQIVIADQAVDGSAFLKRARELEPQASQVLIVGVNGFNEAARQVPPGTLLRLRPFHVEDLLGTIADAERLWAGRDAQVKPDRCVRDLAAKMREPVDPRALLSLEALLAAHTLRDPESQWHSRRASLYATRIARELEMKGAALLDLQWAALFHDIGMLGVPDAVIHKSGPLDAGEWREMRRHPVLGSQMLAAVPFLAGAAEIVHAHHERWDGSGYPSARAKEEICLGARVLAVADFYDAATSERSYRKAHSPAAARDELSAGSGSHFDPRVVDAFMSIPVEDLALIRKSFEVLRVVAPKEALKKQTGG